MHARAKNEKIKVLRSRSQSTEGSIVFFFVKRKPMEMQAGKQALKSGYMYSDLILNSIAASQAKAMINTSVRRTYKGKMYENHTIR